MQFFPPVDIGPTAAEAMARALYALAAIDGVHPAETALIEGFYREVLPEGGTPGPITPIELAAALESPDERLLFVQFALLVAHVHGSISDEEGRLLQAYARALGVTDGEVMALEFGLLKQIDAAMAGGEPA